MKALILAGGRGSRLGELTQSKNKCLLEIHSKPLIARSLDCASQMDIKEIVIVVGYQAEDIKNYCGDEYKGKPIKYVSQLKQRGLVHAIECAKDTIEGDDFVLFLGDELMVGPKHSEMLKRFNKEKPFTICGVIKVDDPNLISKTYGIREENGIITELVEKPDIATIENKSLIKDIMGTGNCVFRNDIFSYISITPENPKRGEKELPDLIKETIKAGQEVKSSLICNEYFNVNLKEEIKNAKSYFVHFSESENNLS